MRTKHASLDRKLFNWVRGQRTKLTVANAIYVLRIHDKSERRHITRRFAQMCARGMLRLVGQSPSETYEVCGNIPTDTTSPEWQQAQQGRLKTPNQQPTPPAVSIPATSSDEFLARGGVLTKLESGTQPYRLTQPTGYGFTFDE